VKLRFVVTGDERKKQVWDDYKNVVIGEIVRLGNSWAYREGKYRNEYRADDLTNILIVVRKLNSEVVR